MADNYCEFTGFSRVAKRTPALMLWLAASLAWMLLFCAESFALNEDAASEPYGKRIALVVGNSEYSDRIGSLKNATSDAEAIAEALRGEHFDVTLLKNTTMADFAGAISTFEAASKSADVVLVYYSGHGFQLNGENYLVPTDAVLQNRAVIDENTIRLNDIIHNLVSPSHLTLIFLDACRNNPLPPSVRGTDSQNGLAEMGQLVNTYVVYSTQPGNVSVDGTGDHSPFAQALLDNMSLPGTSVSDMMVKVRVSVLDSTHQLQRPYDQSTLTNVFYFNPQQQAHVTFGVPINRAPEPSAVSETGTPSSVAAPAEAQQASLQDAVPAQSISLTPTPDAPAGDLSPAPQAPQLPTTPQAATTPSEPASPQPPPTTETPVLEASLPDNGTTVRGLEPGVVSADTVEPPSITGVDITADDQPEVPDDLPMAIQQKLKDLGCYSSSVDGVWGSGSESALRDFYEAKSEPVETQPTADVYLRLQGETKTVCTQVAETPPPPKPTTPKVSTPKTPAKTVTQTKPAAPVEPSQPAGGPTIDINKLRTHPGSFR